MITRNCHGYLPSQVAFYLQNIHIHPRKIYLTIISEGVEQLNGSADRLAGKESGALTEAGRCYSNKLADFLLYEQATDLIGCGKEIVVLTGTANIHYESIQPLRHNGFTCYHTPLLNELRGGDLHGLSKEQIRVRLHLYETITPSSLSFLWVFPPYLSSPDHVS